MSQLKQRFKKIALKNPSMSSYMVFAETVSNSGLTEDIIQRFFLQTVDPEDYTENEVDDVLQYLVSLAKPSKV